MLMFIYNNKEDVIKEVHNGAIQQCIYNYLTELKEDNTQFPTMCNHDLSREKIFDYFDAEIDNCYISDDNLQNPKSEIEMILNNIILSVYDRWNAEQKNS